VANGTQSKLSHRFPNTEAIPNFVLHVTSNKRFCEHHNYIWFLSNISIYITRLTQSFLILHFCRSFLCIISVSTDFTMRSRYSDWLRAGRPRGRSSSPGRVKNFHFSMSSRPALGSTQPPIEWVPGGSFPGGKAAGA
jgi:hypothetical protein